MIKDDKNLISDCGCRFENDYSNAVLLCKRCSFLPAHNLGVDVLYSHKQKAAQLWCESRTSHIAMDADLCEEIAIKFYEYESRIAELEQQLAQEREANRWIPVSERLPELLPDDDFYPYHFVSSLCIVKCKNGEIISDRFMKNKASGICCWDVARNALDAVSWKPIQPPEVRE